MDGRGIGSSRRSYETNVTFVTVGSFDIRHDVFWDLGAESSSKSLYFLVVCNVVYVHISVSNTLRTKTNITIQLGKQ